MGADRTKMIRSQVTAVASRESELKPLSDSELRNRFQSLGEHDLTTDTQIEGMAMIREACLRTLDLRLYDVQIEAGLAMSGGRIAEMATGEGKTLVAALPAALLALSGKGVHVATVNAYLAKRDQQTLAPVYNALGLRCDVLPESVPPAMKRNAYQADITYGTGYDFGFDFLRDELANMSNNRPRAGEQWKRQLRGANALGSDRIQRPFAHAVIDEIDSVLVDEAITPLIISGAVPDGENPAADVFRAADRLAADLTHEIDYTLNEDTRSPHLSEQGLTRVYESLGGFQPSHLVRAWHDYVLQALRARHFFVRDVDYLVREEAVEIIDPNTGRSFKDRKWRSGLHQAVEAHEDVMISYETASEVSISRQRFYQLYPFLCGMTGTATEEVREFKSVYDLDVYVVPRNRPLQRQDETPRVFASRDEVWQQVLQEVTTMTKIGRPVLIGTRSLQRSEELARIFDAAGQKYRLLNARQDAEEADIIGEAGKRGQVTIATNMAGRGADIPLDEGVSDAGGLHVIGIELNDSPRIDRQLSGRAGRQGDPGSSVFFLSPDDALIEEADQGGKHYKSHAQAQRQKVKELARKRSRVMHQNKWLDRIKANG